MSATFDNAGDLPTGMPMYGSRNTAKTQPADKPCHCGSHSVRVDNGQCAACFSRALNRAGVGVSGVKPLRMRAKLDDLMAQKKLEKELSNYVF